MNLLDANGDAIAPRAEDCPAPVYTNPVHPGGQSGYEGAQFSGMRSAFLAFPTNVRRELNQFTRKELARKQRALDSNLGIFGRIKSKIGQHSIGKGCCARPITLDKEWNELNKKRFEARMSNELLYSASENFDFWEDQRFCAETMIGDGEYLEIMAKKEGRDCMQRLDIFEVRSPIGIDNIRSDSGGIWRDGVMTDGYDAPRVYGVCELPDELGYPNFRNFNVRQVPADSMLHVYAHRRAHQNRGITWFYSGINNGIDALDVIALEKGAAKLHSALGLAVRKKQGEAGSQGITGQLEKLLGGNKTVVDENFWRGAAITYLGTDEGIDLLCSERPAPNLLAFLEFLYREIAIGLGLPLEVVYKMGELGGATARAGLEDAQWLFDMVQDKVIMRHSRRIYIWDTARAMVAGEIPVCKDPEWWATAWRGPAKLTVDLGRTADAAVLLMRNAALSHVRYFDERDQDVYQEMTQEIEFRKWLKERCDAAGVDYKELIEPTPGAQTNIHVKSKDE